MFSNPLRIGRDTPDAWRIGAAGLILAGAIVGIAIVIGPPYSRAINPLGALVWVVSGAALAVSVPRVTRPLAGWLVAVAAALVLAGIIRPAGVGEVVISFAVAGALAVIAGGDRSGAWALLVPAIYLPAHLVIGIGRAIARGGAMRTEPPPTAAIVPLAMLLAAAVAGAAVAALLRRER